MRASTNIAGEKIDVVIPYHSKDSDIVEMCITACINNVEGISNIYVVTNSIATVFNRAKVISEDELFDDNLCMEYIRTRLRAKDPRLVSRTGWLFQQFIKMGCSYAIPELSDYYLVVDADVVFLRKTRFFDNNKMLLTEVQEHHKPYFDYCEELLGEPINRTRAFVAHHMLMCKSIMAELLGSIEKRFKKSWYDAILDNIESKDGSMFSEYETYGHYLENHYPANLTVRRLRNAQRFKLRYLLRMLLGQVDYVTIHSYKKPQNNPKTNPQIYKLFVNMARKTVQAQKARRIEK